MVALEHSRVLAIFCSMVFTSDHLCIQSVKCTHCTWVVWNENCATRNREYSRVLECHHYSLAFLNSHDKPLCLLQIIALRQGELCGLRVFSREEACVSSSSGEEKIFNMRIYIATCFFLVSVSFSHYGWCVWWCFHIRYLASIFLHYRRLSTVVDWNIISATWNDAAFRKFLILSSNFSSLVTKT